MPPNEPATPDRPEPLALRISDADRHRVAEVLREAAGEGRLSVEELDERLEATYAAKIAGDLVPLLSDLPVHHEVVPGLPPPSAGVRHQRRGPEHVGPRHDSSYAVMSECKRSGPWTVGDHHGAVAVMGSVVLDLRDAELTSRHTVITANAVMGSVEVVVDAWTAVVVDGTGIMGAFSEGRSKVEAELEPGSPVVRVRGVAFMGSVEVVRKGEPRRRRRALRH